jgi:hypothetical protein
MKSLLLALVLLCAPVAVFAGEISIPGKTCTENCSSQTVSGPTATNPIPLKTQALVFLLSVIF